MSTAGELRSGKGHRDENFPVASWLIDARHRGIILAFYEFVRVADDIADHATLAAGREARAARPAGGRTCSARATTIAEAVRLRAALAERGLPPRHAQDLLTAFRMDVTKLRYRDWDDLIHYCSYSAMPVGRFVLDVHGESRATWAGERRALRRAADQQSPAGLRQGFSRSQPRLHPARCVRGGGRDAGASSARARASPQLLRCIHDLAARNERLLARGRAVLRRRSRTRGSRSRSR